MTRPNLNKRQRKIPRVEGNRIPLEVRSCDGTLIMQSLLEVDLRVDDLQEGLLNVDYRQSRDYGILDKAANSPGSCVMKNRSLLLD